MKVKIVLLILVISVAFLAGCSKEEDTQPSAINEIEIDLIEKKVENVPLTPENFMEKMAYLGVEVGKVKDEGGTGGFPELVYEGLKESPEGNIYGSFVTYQEEGMAIDWFEKVRIDCAHLGMGVEDVVDEDGIFYISTEAYFIGVKRESRSVLIITAECDVYTAKQVFLCFLAPNTDNI